MKHLLFIPLLLVLVSFGMNLSAQSIDLPVTNKLVPHDILFKGSNEVTVNLKGLVVGDTYHVDSMTTNSLLTIVTQPGVNIYPVIVTDSCGREASGSVVLNLPVFSVDMSGRYSLCNTGAVAKPYTISGPADTYSVEVRIDSAGMSRTRVLIRPAGASSLVFDYPADITIIGIANGNGCAGDTIMGSASIVDPDIRFNVRVDSVTCNNGNDGQITLTDPANVPVTFAWSDSGPATAVRTGLAAGSYSVTITDAGDTTLRYTAATTIELLEVMGSDGCPGVAGGIAKVTDGDITVVPMVTDVLCQGQATGEISVVANGNNAAFTFSWDAPGLSGPNVSNLRAGTYGLTVTDPTPFACTWDTTFTILEPASAITLLRDSIRDQTCDLSGYASAVYSGGTGQLTYRWSNGNSTSELGEVDPGLYILSVTDENMCQVTQPFNIQDRRTVVFATIAASTDSLSCSLTSIDLSAQQNTFIVDYQWQDASGNDLGTNRQLMVTMPGRYFVLVTNPANGCSAIDSIDIGRSDELLDLELPIQYDINCTNAVVDLTVTHQGYTQPVDYVWRFNGAAVGTSATLPNVSATGTYEITVTRRDNGCPTVTQTEVVIDRVDPVVSVQAPTVPSSCQEPEVAIGVVATGPYRFDWSTSNGMLIGSTNEATTMAGGAGTYNLLVTDTLNGCSITESISVVVNGSTLIPNAGTDQPLICNGSGTVLNGSVSPRLNGTEVRWYGPAGDVIGEGLQTFTLEEGQHILEAIHPVSGCSSFDTVQVLSEAATSVSYTLQQPPCPEVGGRLFVTDVVGLNGPFTYSSPTGETEPFGNGLRGLRVGTNTLVVTDQFGCELRDTFQIFEGGTFTGTAEDVVIRLGDEAVLGINTNRTDGQLANWTWGNINDTLSCLTCPEPVVASPLETFIATVTVTDTNGCVLHIRQNVIVDEEDLIYMPTAFSPANVDGVNDVYTVFGNAEFVSNINFIHIFDRWGNQVFGNENFVVNDPNEGWTGISPDGKYAPSAVYAYVVSYERWDGETEVRTGGFSLVR